MRVRQASIAAAAVLLAVIVPFPSAHSAWSAASLAQERPNFTGRWVLAIPAGMAGQEQTVTHTAETLTTAHASSGHGHKKVYRLDGAESRNVLVSHGEDVVTLSTAVWNGSALTITSATTYPDGRKLHQKHVWSLDAEGRLVIDATHSGLTATPETARHVYVKK